MAGHLMHLGYRVITVDRPSARQSAADAGVELCDLMTLAERSDVVVLMASLTPSSRGMISAEFLAAMREDAWLVNVARGGLVDEPALIRALQEGRIAGAALDVFDPEPPAEDNPLFTMENVILSPHALCWTADFTREVSASVVEALLEASRGRVPGTALHRELADPHLWRGARPTG